MKSMTGFGQATAQVEGVTIEVSVRSVNGRFLDIRPHLPKKYAAFEAEMAKIVKKQFSRGTCDIYIQRILGAERTEVQFNFQKKIAKTYLEEFRKVLKELKMPDTLTARDLMSIPDFVQVNDSGAVNDKEKGKLLDAVKKAVEACRAERVREGESLRKICLGHLQDLKNQLKNFKALRAQFMAEAPDKLKEKLQKLLQGQYAVEPARLMQEVAILADRSDIEEELNRLSEHIRNVELLVASSESQGKKLDFYAQELLREVNTIGSKSSSAKIVETVVSAKNLIEQFREQVQNIE